MLFHVFLSHEHNTCVLCLFLVPIASDTCVSLCATSKNNLTCVEKYVCYVFWNNLGKMKFHVSSTEKSPASVIFDGNFGFDVDFGA